MSILEKLSGPPNAADASAGGAYLVGLLFNVLPQITALLAALWFILRLVIGWQEYRLNQRKLRGRE
jgi:preprotein translocase subunit SecG